MSPEDAWPFLPTGEVEQTRLINLAETFAGESERIRRLQMFALVFGACVVACLLIFLGYAICKGFDGHLTTAEQMLVKAASPAASSEPVAASAPASSASTAASTQAALSGKKKQEPKAAAAPEPAASSAQATLHELLATSVKAIASTTVAVIWVLVIAISVITISIARAVLSLKPQGLNGSADAEKDGKPGESSAVTLPGLDFAKEVVKLVTDTAQSIRK
ncbi:hypothetical protein ACU6VI_03395 [Sphaerotilus natans]|uniref:hypothetical protein n=1 Tax=Sphaerotilus natans TaxID=34103 RepID=UPI00406D1987